MRPAFTPPACAPLPSTICLQGGASGEGTGEGSLSASDPLLLRPKKLKRLDFLSDGASSTGAVGLGGGVGVEVSR
jgi:hypothetical protein